MQVFWKSKTDLLTNFPTQKNQHMSCTFQVAVFFRSINIWAYKKLHSTGESSKEYIANF